VTFAAPAGTCVIDANEAGNDSYDAAPQLQQTITVGPADQVIDITSTAPVAPVVGDTYTPTATGGGSGNPVTFSIDPSSTSGCTYDAGTGLVTFAAPAGTCVIDANEAGNDSYDAAPQLQQTITVGKRTQTVTFTGTGSASAVVGHTYTPTATGGGSGNPVTFSIDPSSTSGCTHDSRTGVVTFAAPAGTCVIEANQAGNDSYDAAPQVRRNVIVGKRHQTVAFTRKFPTSPVVGDTFSPAASASSGLPVKITLHPGSSSVCTMNDRGIVSFVGVGRCHLDANQAGNDSFDAARQARRVIIVGKRTQTLTFSGHRPELPRVGDSYTAVASASSGLHVRITIDSYSSSVCVIDNRGVVAFVGAGRCIIDANQAGNDDFDAARQARRVVTVGKRPQTVRFTRNAPTSRIVGDTYSPVASASSGLHVRITIGSGSSSVCTVNDRGVVSFVGAGRCVIDANQAGNGSYDAAHVARRVVTVGVAITLHYPNAASALTAAAKTQLKGLANEIRIGGLTHVDVTGYCSSTGSAAYNRILSLERAGVAAAFLKTLLAALGAHGVEISVSSKGASHFVDKPTSAPGNRRVVITAS
jgi:outer membrane protein OmpA-like peptidoglycan-associated protein